ncbi:MAG: hypothetical protein ACXW1Z_24610 [Methylobacter sp.]
MATTMLSLIIDAVENLITSARIVPKRPLVNFDPSNPQELTVKAFARMAADTPNRIETIRQGYENDYGFNHTDGFARTFSGLRHGASNAIWNPYVGIIIDDIDAVISVSTALGVPPPNVLALWIMEGKSSFNNFLHGATGSYQILIGTDVRISQVHSYLRSLVLYQAFGSDQYSAFRRVPGADNELQPPEFSHDSKFDNTFQSLKDAGVSGPAQDSIEVAPIL